jgi:hypothetical protein
MIAYFFNKNYMRGKYLNAIIYVVVLELLIELFLLSSLI